MSDLHIGLVAEGYTDHILIRAALEAILGPKFRLTRLQPEATRPELGTGWGGVLKWCRDHCRRGFGALEDDPTLELFDLVILHVDADIAEKSYSDYGLNAEASSKGWATLPCALPCPPAAATAAKVAAVLSSWLNIGAPGRKTVFCIPSKTTDSWLAAAVLKSGSLIFQDLECRSDVGHWLEYRQKPKIRKKTGDYHSHAAAVCSNWHEVRQLCGQAEQFHQDISRICLGADATGLEPCR